MAVKQSASAKGKQQVTKRFMTLGQLKIVYARVADVHPNSYNPNRQDDHDFHLLILSIMEDGFTQPIVVQQATSDIVDGEHRWTGIMVAEELRRQGITDPSIEQTAELRARRIELLQAHPDVEIPVVYTDMTPEQMRIATLRHNRARGSEDIELSAQVLRDLQELGAIEWAQDSLMLDDTELERLLSDIPAPEALAADDFSEAWVPDTVGDVDVKVAQGPNATAVVQMPSATPGTTHESAMSAAAVEAMRHREEKIAAAKSEEERVMARKETSLYRIALIFSSDQADVVRAVLGNTPAEMILKLCEEYIRLHPDAQAVLAARTAKKAEAKTEPVTQSTGEQAS